MDKETAKEIGLLIRKKRKERGLKSQGELAKLMGVSSETIQKYEAGTYEIPMGKLRKIAEILETDISYFLCKHYTLNNYNISSGDNKNYNYSHNYQKIPVYSLANNQKISDLSEITPISNLMIAKEFNSENAIIVRVVDRGMEPIIKNQSYVGIDLKNKEILPGNIYCVYLSYEGLIIKYIIKNYEGIILKSANPVFNDIPISKKDLENRKCFIIGKVKWVWQDI